VHTSVVNTNVLRAVTNTLYVILSISGEPLATQITTAEPSAKKPVHNGGGTLIMLYIYMFKSTILTTD